MARNEFNIWYSSDFHFGHSNIIEYCNRPFDDVMDMNKALVAKWNEKVAPEDLAWIIGDIAMGHKQKNMTWLSKMNGIKFLVMGNHDPGFGKKLSSSLIADNYSEYFRGVYTSAYHHTKTRFGQVFVNHFPYSQDHRHGERYAEHRPKYCGLPLIHGHVHDLWQVNYDMHSPQINVGVDVWDYSPVHISTIREILNS